MSSVREGIERRIGARVAWAIGCLFFLGSCEAQKTDLAESLPFRFLAIPHISYATPVSLNQATSSGIAAPLNSGGPIASCSVTPALPSGLSFGPTDCAVSGIPTSASAPGSYTVTAQNAAGSHSTTLRLEVKSAAPNIRYPAPSLLATLLSPIASLSAINTGGPIPANGCSVSPALPLGLNLNTRTCAISGTALVPSASQAYTVTAQNAYGSGSASLAMLVNDILPDISFLGGSFILSLNSILNPITITNLGGTIAAGGCSISPALPAGLLFNANTCAISGLPTVLSALTTYTVTATNALGSDSAPINLSIANVPPALSYATGVLNSLVGTLITPLTASNAGGSIQTGGCSIVPALPPGLSLNSNTCQLTGTPLANAVSSTTTYTITAINSAGSGATTLDISVGNVVPRIAYAVGSAAFNLNSLISPLSIVNTGGAIFAGGCSIAPALPTGLSLNSDTCEISGTPLALLAATSYTISATNSVGTGVATLGLSVANILPAISYGLGALSFPIASPISSLLPTNSGGAIQAGGCTVSPALPAGLSLNGDTCRISGTPLSAGISGATTYTVTATNSAGSASTSLVISVLNIAPQIAYSAASFIFNLSSLIPSLSATNSGGNILPGGCSVSPALPAGLSLNSSTCAITGTPTTVAALTNYTVTASNAIGSQSTTIGILVSNIVPAISYGVGALSYPVRSLITSLSPVNSGGAIQSGGCSVSPALPAGLSLNSNTCQISGTPLPAGISGATTYTVTAANSAGSASTSLVISILNIAPQIVYAGGGVVSFVLNTLITSLTTTNTGGDIQAGGCSISPALPLGLSINSSTCTISGLPLLLLSPTTFTITATNSAGNGTTTVNIAVKLF